ncbi:ATP-binding protein [Lachnoclostridium sp. Marseille-P6806]|uniref:ATP-binding protein n=1 Tax=Lachnoclostridium sp. Marseille-P6806 TaxID=2364793 RepID=UPI001032782F|nr:SbcC/MukB-like Walker B domain-containing protein [Lachnoclostridium sp. Marseille-P6806]
MRQIERLLLIHWYSFDKELIEFGNVNFLTGKNASGKSTIIDAMQLLLLGDSAGSYFNKAANAKSVRTLKGYLFGETGDDGDTGFQYLRKGPFTSYISLEFLDTDKKERFVTGFTADCYSDLTFKFRWFILRKTGLPENLFIDPKTRVPYSMAQDLKPFLNRTVGKNRYDFYDTNHAFQNALLGVYGQVKRKYFMLLRKAVPFTPITDIEQFITESICDIKGRVNVEDMQSEIRQYKRLEDDAARIRTRIDRLGQIHSVSDRYEQQKETRRQQKYIADRAEQVEKQSEKERLERDLRCLQDKIADNQGQAENLQKEAENLKTEIDELNNTYLTSDLRQRQKTLEQKSSELTARRDELLRRRDKVIERIRSCGEDWAHTADELDQLSTGSDAGGALCTADSAVKSSIRQLRSVNTGTLTSVPIRESMQCLSDLKEQMANTASDLQGGVRALKNTMDDLSERVDKLRRGIKPYPNHVVRVKALLERQLMEQSGKTVPVHILADLLEIRDLSWQNAIEGYLDKQKFYLLVPAEYYRDALVIYDHAKREQGVYDAGLVDIGSLRRDYEQKSRQALTDPKGSLNSTGKAGALSEEIETDNPDARLYVDHLLGNVMKCGDVMELNRYRTAITRSGMLYKGYVSRKINPSRYENPFIGRESIKRQLQQLQKELNQNKALYERQDSLFCTMRALSRTELMSDYEITAHEQSIQDSAAIPELQKEQDAVRREYDSIDFTYLERLKRQRDEKKQLYDRKSKENQALLKENGGLEEKVRQIRDERLPEVQQSLETIADRIQSCYDRKWMEAAGEIRFQKELENERKGTRGSLSLRESFSRAAEATKTIISQAEQERSRLRAAYNADFKMPYDISLESNREYDKELQKLSENELSSYVDKIRDSREKAYNQFRDDFIAKLKSNIEDIKKQIHELNDYLRNNCFGTDRYQFIVEPRAEYKRYYDMIMDPLLMDTGGWNIASESFNKKYQKEIDELFRILILSDEDTSEARRQEYERNIEKFTDYRSYLVFDMTVTNEQEETQRLSRMLNKKSGGETQVPFYIALLASFSQVLRIRSKQNNTIRMIILDEAFSKLDGERIRQCVPLLKEFELQAIFSAPTDKIPEIAPLVDRNTAVYKDGHHSFTRHFDPREIGDDPDERSDTE